MKYLFLLLLTVVFNIMLAQDITFTSDKRLVQPSVNGEVKAENTIEIKSSLKTPLNGKKTYTWTINGSSEPGKGWELVKAPR